LAGRVTEAAAKQIGIVLFPDVEELDAIGPWEVLSYWTRNLPQDGYAVSCLISISGDELTVHTLAEGFSRPFRIGIGDEVRELAAEEWVTPLRQQW
jgi:hypothetical protein